jgi:hypothetical protein
MVVTVNRTQDRNQMLLRFHKEHPKDSYAQLGKMFAISRQRCWYLVQRSQAWEKRKEKRDELFRQNLYQSIQPWQRVTGEIFAMARPRQYYRRQQEIRNEQNEREGVMLLKQGLSGETKNPKQ